jgi:hypothetical protein
MQEAVLSPFLFRLFRLHGGFLQELYDFEKILAVKKINADTLSRGIIGPEVRNFLSNGPPIQKQLYVSDTGKQACFALAPRRLIQVRPAWEVTWW